MPPFFQKVRGGTIIRSGRDVVHLSEGDFAKVMKGKSKCFVCARSAKKNKEHIIPDWVIRMCGLRGETIKIPRRISQAFTTYKVPCCVECNKILADKLERPISKAFSLGFEAVKTLVASCDADLYAWLCFLFLKTHYKDLFVRDYSRRGIESTIGDNLDWTLFRDKHAHVAAQIFNGSVACSAVGSMKVFQIQDHEIYGKFSYRDSYEDECCHIRIYDIGLIWSLKDLGACNYYIGGRLETLGDSVTMLQFLAIANEYEFAARRLFGKWSLARVLDPADGSLKLEGDVVEPMGVRPAKEEFRREGLLYQILPFLEEMETPEDVIADTRAAIQNGSLTYLPDEARQTLDGCSFHSEWQNQRAATCLSTREA